MSLKPLLHHSALNMMNELCIIISLQSVYELFFSLQDSYWTVIHEKTVEVLSLPSLAAPPPNSKPFQMLNFGSAHSVLGDTPAAYLLAQCHAVWQHASIGQLSHLPG